MAELSSDPISITVESRAHGWRIDYYLSRLYPNYSRALFKKAIDQESILVNGLSVKPSRRLRVNDSLSVRLPELPDETIPPEDIPLDIVYEDDAIIVINKAAGMIVHPGKGNYLGTLAGALQFHFDTLSDIAGQHRPGIVHRLDRNTTGVMVAAKDNQVHGRLSRQFELREVTKEYRALVWGNPSFDSDFIETHIRVHPKSREKMHVCKPGGNSREAVTFYEVLERFEKAAYVKMLPKTGRTHQLRVHMQHLGHPLLADSMYGGHESVNAADLAITSDSVEPLIARHALHAYRLSFQHPKTDKRMEFEAPFPNDFEQTLNKLQSVAEDRVGT
jgi:23S rRNA pseudouridine1911/1915/1917 synthase